MDWTRAFRALVGAGAAVVIATSGPALAAGGTSTSQVRQASSKAADAVRTCSPGASACPIRITFAKGAYSGQAHSELTGVGTDKWFVVHARADQAMVVVVEGAGATRGHVLFPNGQSSGQPGGRVFDGVLPVSGDYRIRVTESPMGEGWSGRVDVVALIY